MTLLSLRRKKKLKQKKKNKKNNGASNWIRSYRVPNVRQPPACPLEYRRRVLQGVFYVKEIFASGKAPCFNLR